ncbi:hypothetical protein BpHYR1_031632 [Brachionus plicatilis]|uniref:Uncharacterized protein n=1 Tax=Brachionus plicatilis TaxID=10195 RepID=A0A3M7S4J3_BRAPC|nr:hypothetical protein BpHYR1_031632 [Brachionus plicatilis]
MSSLNKLPIVFVKIRSRIIFVAVPLFILVDPVIGSGPIIGHFDWVKADQRKTNNPGIFKTVVNLTGDKWCRKTTSNSDKNTNTVRMLVKYIFKLFSTNVWFVLHCFNRVYQSVFVPSDYGVTQFGYKDKPICQKFRIRSE